MILRSHYGLSMLMSSHRVNPGYDDELTAKVLRSMELQGVLQPQSPTAIEPYTVIEGILPSRR